MVSLPLGVCLLPHTASSLPSTTSLHCNPYDLRHFSSSSSSRILHDRSLSLPSSGVCRASQMAELFPIQTLSPEIVVREARMEDFWEVAETHCSSFFPRYSFPLDFALRLNRVMGMLVGYSVPSGCKRICLVAIVDEGIKIGGFDAKFTINKGYVAGILTLDTVANFLPRKGPQKQRRTGIAYISNVAVRERFRRKGIAKQLVVKAETLAKTWGCRAIALHCELQNPGATRLYRGQGFKCIRVPDGANWPHPRISPDVKFNFMMKLLNPTTSTIIT